MTAALLIIDVQNDYFPGGALPLWNAEATLGQQLEALLASVDDDMEILVVDNRSTDDSRSVADRFAIRDRRVRVIDASARQGEPHARNVGVAAATSDRIAFCDADDVVAPTWASAMRDALGEPCRVTCRFTHVYPDGPAPYVTVIAPARRGEEIDQWHAMKQAAGEAIVAGGGTITHHHAVGRDHRPWYDRQRPEPFAAALAGAKAAVDPAGLMNPGVLLG